MEAASYHQLLASQPWVFIPNSRSDLSLSCSSGQWYTTEQCVWEDNSGIWDSTQTSVFHQTIQLATTCPKSLHVLSSFKAYSSLEDVFLSLGVRQIPKLDNYISLLNHAASQPGFTQEAVQICLRVLSCFNYTDEEEQHRKRVEEKKKRKMKRKRAINKLHHQALQINFARFLEIIQSLQPLHVLGHPSLTLPCSWMMITVHLSSKVLMKACSIVLWWISRNTSQS